MIIDEKRPNGLDVLAAMGLRLLQFLTGWARHNMPAIEAEADSATASRNGWHKAEFTELNTAPLGFSAVVDRQFQEGPTMSLRILGSVMCVSLFALATVTHAQNAPQTTANSNVKLAQGTTQPGPAGAPVKTSKGKVKKAKSGKGTGSGGSESRPPAPAGGSGPPDPGKYM